MGDTLASNGSEATLELVTNDRTLDSVSNVGRGTRRHQWPPTSHYME